MVQPWVTPVIAGGFGLTGATLGAVIGARLSGGTERDVERERQRYQWERDVSERLGRLESRLAGIEGLLRFFHPELRGESPRD